jgi:hypothetical protein
MSPVPGCIAFSDFLAERPAQPDGLLGDNRLLIFSKMGSGFLIKKPELVYF